jgi:hypothetical protein
LAGWYRSQRRLQAAGDLVGVACGERREEEVSGAVDEARLVEAAGGVDRVVAAFDYARAERPGSRAISV